VWEDVVFLDGFPGKFAAFARKGDGHWFVAAINADGAERTLSLDLSGLPGAKAGTRIGDAAAATPATGPAAAFEKTAVTVGPDGKVNVTLRPAGGLVIRFE
jgi:hypothetical protein